MGKPHLWLSASPSKRWGEVFFLAYSPFWILWTLGILVPFQLYERCNEWGYMAIGLCVGLPPLLLPPLLQPRSEKIKPWHNRYWVKANVWIAIFSFIGNYFWTHYFYQLLGAQYTFPAHMLNQVPICLYFMTHSYFLFYHTIANMCIRRARHAVAGHGPNAMRLATAAVVFLLAYATAYMETVTIAHFPHYRFKDKSKMYTVGCLFYAIYFFVSFPVFFYMDEKVRSNWSLGRAAMEALGSGMLVTILLDIWRLSIGGIALSSKQTGLTWA